MQHDVSGGKIVRNCQAWPRGLLVDQQLVMVPAQTRTHSPMPKMDQILYEHSLFEIRSISRKLKCPRRGGIELRGVGDDIGEVLIQQSIVRLHPELPFLSTVIDCNRCLEISLAEPVVLRENH